MASRTGSELSVASASKATTPKLHADNDLFNAPESALMLSMIHFAFSKRRLKTPCSHTQVFGCTHPMLALNLEANAYNTDNISSERMRKATTCRARYLEIFILQQRSGNEVRREKHCACTLQTLQILERAFEVPGTSQAAVGANPTVIK